MTTIQMLEQMMEILGNLTKVVDGLQKRMDSAEQQITALKTHNHERSGDAA